MYYWANGKVRKAINVTTEGELYGASECYGSGGTVVEFEDGFTCFESDCVELSVEALSIRLWVEWSLLMAKFQRNFKQLQDESNLFE